jgi:hypothetical protein
MHPFVRRVQRCRWQTACFQHVLHFRFGFAGRAVADHLQHTRNAERRNEDVGVRLFLDDLFQQIEGKTGVGRGQLCLIHR